MEKDWVNIFSTGKMYRAQLAQECLSNQGIESVIMNKTDSATLHPSGFIEVFVRRENVIKAMHFLKTAHFE